MGTTLAYCVKELEPDHHEVPTSYRGIWGADCFCLTHWVCLLHAQGHWICFCFGDCRQLPRGWISEALWVCDVGYFGEPLSHHVGPLILIAHDEWQGWVPKNHVHFPLASWDIDSGRNPSDHHDHPTQTSHTYELHLQNLTWDLKMDSGKRSSFGTSSYSCSIFVFWSVFSPLGWSSPLIVSG